MEGRRSLARTLGIMYLVGRLRKSNLLFAYFFTFLHLFEHRISSAKYLSLATSAAMFFPHFYAKYSCAALGQGLHEPRG